MFNSKHRAGPRGPIAALLVGWALALAGPALAQDFPSQPLRIVVGQAAGGGMDVLARTLGERLSASLGKPVVVENRVGAGGVIGTEFVARAPADGHTLLMGPIGNMVFAPVLTPKLRYDPQKDFAPVSLVATFPLVLLVNAKTPVETIPQLVEYIRRNPKAANYGGSGPAFQFAVEQFKIKTQTPGEFVQYKSMAETINALIAGDLLAAFVDPGPAAIGLANGRLRALAVTSPGRFSGLPTIPTVSELGLPDLQMQFWAGLFAPAGTPPTVLRKLEGELRAIVAQPEVEQRMKVIHVQPASGTGADLARTLQDDLVKWREVGRIAGIKPNE